MANSIHQHNIDLLPDYVLDLLDHNEARAVSQHIDTCEACSRELAAYHVVASQVALTVPMVEAPPHLKSRLMKQVEPPVMRATRPTPQVWWKRLWGNPRPLVIAWQVATLLIILTIGASNIAVWRMVDHDVAGAVEAGLQTIRLKGTELAPDAKGMVIISADGKHGLLYVDKLPFLEARHVYQAWLGEVAAPLNAGILDLTEQGTGWLEVYGNEKQLTDYPLYRITIEPAGGSPQPGGNVVLVSYSP